MQTLVVIPAGTAYNASEFPITLSGLTPSTQYRFVCDVKHPSVRNVYINRTSKTFPTAFRHTSLTCANKPAINAYMVLRNGQSCFYVYFNCLTAGIVPP